MDVISKVLPASIIAGLVVGSSTTSAQFPTNDFFPGEYVPYNVVETNDLLDPNDPTDLDFNVTDPHVPSFHLRNYGANGTDSE